MAERKYEVSVFGNELRKLWLPSLNWTARQMRLG